MLFTWVLLLLTVLLGGFWIYDRFVARKERQFGLKNALAALDKSKETFETDAFFDAEIAKVKAAFVRPAWLEYSAGLFPVILFVFCFRSFVLEPFRIPSGSMLPTLQNGDFILVNKFHYGLRFPTNGFRLTPGADVARGDVVVFRYPMDKNLDYIKRVVAIGGDTIEYQDQKLTVNGKVYPQRIGNLNRMKFETWIEKTGDIEHAIKIDLLRRDDIPSEPELKSRAHLKSCIYSSTAFGNRLTCKVPAGHYFVMGDNRGDSEDSRYWGFVPEENILGKAFYIWLNTSDYSRIGRFD